MPFSNSFFEPKSKDSFLKSFHPCAGMEEELQPIVALPVQKANMTESQRRSCYEFLLTQSTSGTLKKGSISTAARRFGFNTQTISSVWARGQASISNGNDFANVSSRIQGNSGRKKKEIDIAMVKDIPLRQRKNIRSLAFAMNVSKSTLHRRIKEGKLYRHSSALKPFLTEANKKSRLQYALSMIEPTSLNTELPTFKGSFDRVHIDEKWFYLTEESGGFYLVPDEEEPQRTAKSKRFLLKVMFLAAVARPRFDYLRNSFFNGKIGIYPLVFQEPAKRSSKNRPVGTMETKPIPAITKEVTKRILIEKVFPDIRSVWPQSSEPGPIEVFVQQDNAKPHPSPSDPIIIEEGDKDGFKIRLVCQPPNSPDTNVLDLGFFRAIQSLQHQKAPNVIDELVSAVIASFNEMEKEKLNDVFLSLQNCLISVMKVHGGNNYKLPHMGKGRLARLGRLPINLQCPTDILEGALDAIRDV
jgi:hypothetical protein